MATPGLLSNCLWYFVHLNELGAPVPSTMFSKNSNNKKDPGYGCREARLSPTQENVPAGKVQCFFPNHLRYFYKVSIITGDILPNSMWSQIGKPASMCSGTYKVLEYKIWK